MCEALCRGGSVYTCSLSESLGGRRVSVRAHEWVCQYACSSPEEGFRSAPCEAGPRDKSRLVWAQAGSRGSGQWRALSPAY